MGKMDIIRAVLANPKGIVLRGYQAMMQEKSDSKYTRLLRDKYGITYLPTLDIMDLVPERQDTIYPYCYLNGTSMVTLMMVMRSLARQRKDCTYLEIGSFRGESLMNLADVAKDCTSVTLSKEEMKELNFPAEFIRMDGMFIEDRPNVTCYKQSSKTFDFNALNKKFDLILVDGDNSYNGMLHDTQTVYKLLKDENSVIVWHSYAADMENETVRHHVLAGILDGLPKEEHGNLYHVSNTTCAVFTRGKYPSKNAVFPTYPNKVFSVDISMKKL